MHAITTTPSPSSKIFYDLHPRANKAPALASWIAERIANDPEIKAVEHLGEEFQIGARRLLRLFDDSISVNPKWMIRRYVLQEVADRMAAAAKIDWAKTAMNLAYSA